MEQTIEHNYPVYIAVWFAVSILTLLIFKGIGRKMKKIEDRQTRNSLFTVMIFTGLPLLLLSVLAPLIFVIGDKNMEFLYKAIWIGLILIFLIYFLKKQKSNKKV
jgi:L-asparagine transporter-like permease